MPSLVRPTANPTKVHKPEDKHHITTHNLSPPIPKHTHTPHPHAASAARGACTLPLRRAPAPPLAPACPPTPLLLPRLPWCPTPQQQQQEQATAAGKAELDEEEEEEEEGSSEEDAMSEGGVEGELPSFEFRFETAKLLLELDETVVAASHVGWSGVMWCGVCGGGWGLHHPSRHHACSPACMHARRPCTAAAVG